MKCEAKWNCEKIICSNTLSDSDRLENQIKLNEKVTAVRQSSETLKQLDKKVKKQLKGNRYILRKEVNKIIICTFSASQHEDRVPCDIRISHE